MKPLKSMNTCFGFLLARASKSSWGNSSFTATLYTEDSPSFLSLAIYVSSAEKEHIETDACVFLLMLFQATPHLGSPPVLQVCNNEPTQAKATVSLTLLLFGVFLAEMPC